LFPFMLLFGVYVVVHGHLTPGGGFPGGVIMAAAILMLLLAYGREKAQGIVSSLQADVAESLGGLILVALGILAILLTSSAFLTNNIIPMGTFGNLFSAGIIPFLNIGVGIKVAAGLITIIYAMLGLRGLEK